MPNWAWSAMSVSGPEEQLSKLTQRLERNSSIRFMRRAVIKYCLLAEAGLVGATREIDFPPRPSLGKKKKGRKTPHDKVFTQLLQWMHDGEVADSKMYCELMKLLVDNGDYDLGLFSWDGPLFTEDARKRLEPILRENLCDWVPWHSRKEPPTSKDIWNHIIEDRSEKPNRGLGKHSVDLAQVLPKRLSALLAGFNPRFLDRSTFGKEPYNFQCEYDENCDLYDTKWPIFEVTVGERYEGVLTMAFQTAWSEPMSAIIAMSMEFDELRFIVETIYEFDLSAHRTEINRGQRTKTEVGDVVCYCLDECFDTIDEVTAMEKRKELVKEVMDSIDYGSDTAIIKVPSFMVGSLLMKDVF